MNDDPIAVLERELVEAARRQAERGRRAHPAARLARGLAIATLLVVSVAVAAGAILLLGNRDHSQVTTGSSAATSQHELLQTLGTLRTRATATDRAVIVCAEQFASHPSNAKCLRAIPGAVSIAESPGYAEARARLHSDHPARFIRRYLARLGNPRWDLTLIRTVPLRRSGLGFFPTAALPSVSFFPGTWQSSARSAQRTAGILATLVDQGSAYPFAMRASVRTVRAHGLALMTGGGVSKHPGGINMVAENEGAIIVPDGVARITVGMVSLVGRPSVHWLQNVTATVHDNVATVELNTPTFPVQLTSTLETRGFVSFAPHSTLAQVTWFDAHGRIIMRTTTAMQLDVYFKPKPYRPPIGIPPRSSPYVGHT